MDGTLSRCNPVHIATSVSTVINFNNILPSRTRWQNCILVNNPLLSTPQTEPSGRLVCVCVHTWTNNKVRELVAVKVLHTSLLNTTMVAFRVLPLGSYAPMPAPSPPFKTILELFFVEYPSDLPLYYSWCHQCHQNAFLSIFPLSSGTEKSHCGLDPVNRQGIPTQFFV